MKNHFICLAGALLILACKPAAEQTEQVSEPTNVDRIAALYDAFAQGDIETVLANFDAEIVWNEAENFLYADKNPYVGRDSLLNGLFARLGSEWDNFRLEEKEFHNVGDDGVLVTGRYRGTYKATGKQLDAQFAHLWALRDTLAASFQQYTDTWQARQVATPEAGE